MGSVKAPTPAELIAECRLMAGPFYDERNQIDRVLAARLPRMRTEEERREMGERFEALHAELMARRAVDEAAAIERRTAMMEGFNKRVRETKGLGAWGHTSALADLLRQQMMNRT